VTNSMNAVDTNVLIYVHDPRDAVKQEVADGVVRSLVDGVLLWQVACEFIAASRKLEPFGFDRASAYQEIRRLQQLWTTKLPSWPVFETAETLVNNYSLSVWDAMIIAACLESGVTLLYSEDFDAYSNIEGLSLINPFKVP
jgi:predicted nucleic acid-binding protein